VAGRGETGAHCPYCPAPVPLGAVIRVCPRCGTVHHNACWKTHGRCGSYECAPAQQAALAGSVLTITDDDLDRVVPLPARPLVVPTFAVGRPARSGPRWNRLAIASLVTALAGIPFFGVVTGLVAIGLGCFALVVGPDRGTKGTGLAVAGLFLGCLDVIAWILCLGYALSRPVDPAFDRFRLRPAQPAQKVEASNAGTWLPSDTPWTVFQDTLDRMER
jgi:hypothetical protein